MRQRFETWIRPLLRWVPILLIVATAQLWGHGLDRPLDQAYWRDLDMAAVARNFVREGMNPLEPRIDWRGDGPGLAEMELPVLPWLMAWAQRLFGADARAGRWICWLAGLGALAAFLGLARERLSPAGWIAAAVVFSSNPLVSRLATGVQPDALMLAAYVLAVWSFWRWIEREGRGDYLVAAAATAFAILTKLPAAHVGILFALLCFDRWGIAALRDRRLWLFAALALAPAAAWYLHAHRYWMLYGNSLGLSNETHWLAPDLLVRPEFALGWLRAERSGVWMPAGLALALLSLAFVRPLSRVKLELYWLTAVATYLLLALRTTGDEWAAYYHVVAVPPAALILGRGFAALTGHAVPSRILGKACAVLAVAAATLVILFPLHASNGATTLAWKAAAGLAATVAWLLLAVATRGGGAVRERAPDAGALGGTALALVAAALLAATTLDAVRRSRWALEERAPHPLSLCARDFRRIVPPGSLIVASGGPCLDGTGKPVAYHAPYMFYWMDRKGFGLCHEEHSVGALRGLRRRGAEFFVAERAVLDARPDLEETLRQAFPVMDVCEAAILFDLAAGGG